MVLEFLGERIRKAREAAIVHPHGEALAFHVGRGNMRQIGLALAASVNVIYCRAASLLFEISNDYPLILNLN